eukprot:gnl/Dysnectes_brevis/2729_a3314_1112.p1 GENE.gnl/Dysnectes_brevis/2729_a3314_1112~~gnl/Dysnectes_brevis/2729_a3314_1112.p1  ORF type:complete len:357 (-),score=59.70 gnl/Dysnectes_brevis/2729_a3314_1112:89-1159(-)
MFTPISLPNTSLVSKTRFIRSATAMGVVDGNSPHVEKLSNLYIDLAQNNVGIIMSGHVYVTEQGKAHPCQVSIASDDVVGAHRQIMSNLHAAVPESLIFAQLAHAGAMAITAADNTDLNMSSPLSALLALPSVYAAAAVRAQAAGYDGVQIHAGHGYLMAQSLSPFFNKRTDELKAGPTLLLLVVNAIKKACPDYPLAVKLQGCDYVLPEGTGLEVSASVEAAMLLAPHVCLIELTGGLGRVKEAMHSPARGFKAGPHYTEEIAAFRAALGDSVVLAATGGYRTREHIEAALSPAGGLDMVAPSRPFLREPGWLADLEETDAPSQCVSCNACFLTLRSGTGSRCVVREKIEARKKK